MYMVLAMIFHKLSVRYNLSPLFCPQIIYHVSVSTFIFDYIHNPDLNAIWLDNSRQPPPLKQPGPDCID